MAMVELRRPFEMEDQLIPIDQQPHSQDGNAKLALKMNSLDTNVNKLRVVKYVAFISFIFTSLLFLLMVLIIYAHFQWHTTQLSQLQTKLQGIENGYNESLFTITELQLRQQHSIIKSQMNNSSANKHLMKIEDMWNEFQGIIQTIDQSPQKQILCSAMRNISETYVWNVTDILLTKPGNATRQHTDNEFINYGVRWSAVFPIWKHLTAKLKMNLLHYKMLISINIFQKNDTKSNKIVDDMSSVRYIFKDEREGKMVDVAHTAHCLFNQTIKHTDDMFDVKILHFRGITTRYNVINGYLLVWLLMEPPEISRTYFSTDGTLLWRIDSYKERKLNEDEGRVNFQQSPYFYTHPDGYRMRLHAHLNHIVDVRFSLVFYCGPNDALLPDRFPFRATVTMFNQDDPSRNLFHSEDYFFASDKKTTFIILWGDAFFIEKSGFVRNNTMILRVGVDLLPTDDQ